MQNMSTVKFHIIALSLSTTSFTGRLHAIMERVEGVMLLLNPTADEVMQ
jgi:hypothetical protein